MAARVELESTGLSQAQSISNRPQCQIMLTSLYWQRRGSSNPQTLTGRQALARLRNTKLCLLLYDHLLLAESRGFEPRRPYGLHEISSLSPYQVRAALRVNLILLFHIYRRLSTNSNCVSSIVTATFGFLLQATSNMPYGAFN